MYLDSNDKLKKNLKECLKYSPNDQKQPLNNNNSSHDVDMDGKPIGGAQQLAGATQVKKIKMNPEDVYNNIIIDESQLIHHQSNNKENNIVDIAMSMASVGGVAGTTVTATAPNSVVHAATNGPTKKMKTSRPSKSRKKANSTMVQMAATNNHDPKNILYENDANLLDMNNGNGTDASELQYIILQSDTKIFSCSNCEQQFISEDFLKQHIQKAHPIVTELVQTPALSPMSLNQQQQQLIYLCHFCESKQFTSEIQLSHHMFIHSEISNGTLSDNPFPFCSCEHCLPLTGEKMIVGEDPTEAELAVAMQQQIEEPPRQVVQTTTTITASGKQQTLYSCSVCNKSTFKTEHRLKKHMRIHRNEQPFSCDICHKVYNASSSLKTHQRMAHGGVTNQQNATNHVIQQQQQQQQVTIENNVGIATTTAVTMAGDGKSQQNVSGTINSSMDAGPVQCSTCNKTFTKAYQLSVHMNTVHDKDRQYSCQYCSYRFSTAQKLNAHMRQHIESNDVILTTTQENEEDDTSNVEKITEITME